MQIKERRKGKKLLYLGAVVFVCLLSLSFLFSIEGETQAASSSFESSSLATSSDVVALSTDSNKEKDDSLSFADVDKGVVYSTYSPGILEEEIADSEESNEDTSSSKREEPVEYTIKEGDTISTIASLFGLKSQTLLWVNNLQERSIIKPGDTITIPVTDGLMYKVKKGDTLGEIAKAYQADVNEIIEFNKQIDSDKITAGQELFLPNGVMPPPPAPKPKPKPTPQPSPRSSIASSQTSGACHQFPYGYCTWYVAQKRCVPWGGDAKNWLSNAHAYGYAVCFGKFCDCGPGSILVTGESRWGHVGYVISSNESSITISEMNHSGWGRVDQRTILKGASIIRGCIY